MLKITSWKLKCDPKGCKFFELAFTCGLLWEKGSWGFNCWWWLREMFGWAGGVFSTSELRNLCFLKEEELGLRLEEEIDLRKLEEMLPKNPLESVLLNFCLIFFFKNEKFRRGREKEREFRFKCWMESEGKMKSVWIGITQRGKKDDRYEYCKLKSLNCPFFVYGEMIAFK